MVKPMNNEKIMRTYSLTEKHLDMLDELCKREDRTVSAIVRLAIEYYYKREEDES